MVVSSRARGEINAFATYAADCSDAFATEQFIRLSHVLAVTLAEATYIWGHFYVTGAPYRAYLFRVGRRISFWIAYAVDETRKIVNVLRFWNASKNPQTVDD